MKSYNILMKTMSLLSKQRPKIKQPEIYFNLYCSGKGRKKVFSFPYQLRFSIRWPDKQITLY